MFDERLTTIIDSAYKKFENEINTLEKPFSDYVMNWIRNARRIPEGKSPLWAFKTENIFPFFLVPYWLEQVIHKPIDDSLQEDLICSWFYMFFYIIMVDDIMDQDQVPVLELSPALHIFHTWMQISYQRHFHAEHPFWTFFRTVWFKTAAVTTYDAYLEDITKDDFINISSQKAYFAGIPIGAVCYKYNRLDLLKPWTDFIYAFGQWNQMFNDLMSWKRDYENGAITYVLCEGKRQKKEDETVYNWMMREGFGWGLMFLLDFTKMIKEEKVPPLECRAVEDYMKLRESHIQKRLEQFNIGSMAYNKIYNLLRSED